MSATPQTPSPSGVEPNQTCENSRPERVVGLCAGVGRVSLAPSSKLFNLNYSGAKAAAVFPRFKNITPDSLPPHLEGHVPDKMSWCNLAVDDDVLCSPATWR